MNDKGIFDLTPEQKKAFNRLKRAYNDCLKSGIYFINNYGNLQACDSSLVCGYGDRAIHADGVSEVSIHDVGEPENSISIVGEWADDEHYYGLTEKGHKKYFDK